MPLRLFSIVLSVTLLLLPSRRNTAELPMLRNVFPATVLPENGLPHTSRPVSKRSTRLSRMA